MTKQQDQQLEFPDFYLPFSGHLDPENRWIQLARLVPWQLAEEVLASCVAKLTAHLPLAWQPFAYWASTKWMSYGSLSSVGEILLVWKTR